MAITLESGTVTNNSIQARVIGLSGTSYANIQIKLNNHLKELPYSSNGMSAYETWTGLVGGTAYSATSYIKSNGGTVAQDPPTATWYTLPDRPTISSYSSTTSSITISWTMTGGNNGFRLYVGTYSGGSNILSNSSISSSSRSYTVTGLSPSTTYYFTLTAKNQGNSWGSSATGTKSTDVQTTPIPSTPSRPTATVVSGTPNAVTVSWSPVSGATSYTVRIRKSGTTGTSYVTTGTSYTFYGLDYGTAYLADVMATNSSGSSGWSGDGSVTTGVNLSVYLTPSSTSSTTMSASWSSVTGVSTYLVRIVRGTTSSGTLFKEISTSSTSYSITGLAENTAYHVTVTARNSSGTSLATASNYGYTRLDMVTMAVSSRTTSSISVNISSMTGASSYKVEAWHTNGTLISSGTTSHTGSTVSITLSGLNRFVTYNLKCWAVSSSSGNGIPRTISTKTKEDTAPTLSISKTDSIGKMYFEWTASDTESGLRASNTYQVRITGADKSTYVSKGYTTDKFYTFLTDGDGLAFQDGKRYNMSVIAYDEDNNSSTKYTAQLTYSIGRPNSWYWVNEKSKGVSWNLTASEWNSFCKRINQFRQYKLKENYAFTEVVRGDDFTATIYNQAVRAIREIETSGLPAEASKGNRILATHFTMLSKTLNSIG